VPTPACASSSADECKARGHLSQTWHERLMPAHVPPRCVSLVGVCVCVRVCDQSPRPLPCIGSCSFAAQTRLQHACAGLTWRPTLLVCKLVAARSHSQPGLTRGIVCVLCAIATRLRQAAAAGLPGTAAPAPPCLGAACPAVWLVCRWGWMPMRGVVLLTCQKNGQLDVRNTGRIVTVLCMHHHEQRAAPSSRKSLTAQLYSKIALLLQGGCRLANTTR
jgi:hypothetical protein